MHDITIRKGGTTDASAIAAIINQEIRNGLAIWRYAERPLDDIRAMIEARLSAGHAVYVADSMGEILGWASYGDFSCWRRLSRHDGAFGPHQTRGPAAAASPAPS